jgi:hypothetical protein
MASLAALAALALCAGAAGAQDFESQIRAALAELRPATRGAPVGRWTEPPFYGWLPDGRTYVGPFGVKLDRGCMAFEGKAYPAVPIKFVLGLRQMHETLQACARERVLPATAAQVYRVAPEMRVYCDPKACEYPDDPDVKAIACADREKRTIWFKTPEDYFGAGTAFHELAHASGHVDNQTTLEHRRHRLYPLRDEVYFWERHCFAQDGLVERMRTELDKRLEAAKLDKLSEDQAVLSKIHAAAYETCATPFRYNVRRPYAVEAEVKAVCGQYAGYLMMEINLARSVRRLAAEAGGCSAAADKADCPAAGFFEPGAPERRAADRAGLLPPAAARAFSGQAFIEWTWAACTFFDSRDARDNPSGSLWACASKLAERAAESERLVRLADAGVSWDEIGKLQAYLRRLAAKAKALREGPGRYDELIKEKPAEREKAVAGYYAASLAACGVPEARFTRFCADLGLDEPPMRLLGALAVHWRPKP